MVPLRIFPNAEDMAEDLSPGQIVDCGGAGADVRIGGLARGTVGGKPTVSIMARLPDGKYIFFETTLALLLTATDAFKAVHGDPR